MDFTRAAALDSCNNYWNYYINHNTMSKTKEIKLMIIENFIDYYTTDETEREEMKEEAATYVEEDWVDEIGQAFDINENS